MLDLVRRQNAAHFAELLADAKRKHDEAKAGWECGEVPDEVYLQRLDELEQLQRTFRAHAGGLGREVA